MRFLPGLPGGALAATALACAGDAGPTPLTDPVVSTVMVSPRSASIAVGGTLQLSAAARDATNQPIAVVFTWTSRAPGIATVAAGGMISGLADGVVQIVASTDGRADSATITVIATHDPDSLGVPQLIAHDYIDQTVLQRITRFRSGFGHDYSDGVEQCRSMKHYFQPRSTVDWATVPILAPVSGEIVALVPEMTFGTQAQIVSSAVPAATVIIFHLNPAPGWSVGQMVAAGDTLGTHIGSQTMSDIAIRLQTLTGSRLVSYFEAMPDSVFAGYVALGIATRDALVISRAERDASPLQCTGEAFDDPGTLENWVDVP